MDMDTFSALTLAASYVLTLLGTGTSQTRTVTVRNPDGRVVRVNHKHPMPMRFISVGAIVLTMWFIVFPIIIVFTQRNILPLI